MVKKVTWNSFSNVWYLRIRKNVSLFLGIICLNFCKLALKKFGSLSNQEITQSH